MIFKGKNKFWVIIGVLLFTSVCILWEYSNGGVITHHLLAREDLPGISNWWGLLTVPILTWICLSITSKRLEKSKETQKSILNRFLAALIFGTIASLLWELDFDEILRFYILLPFFIALFKPLYLPEYLLGFVIGMVFTFGGILPILVGTVILIGCYLVYKTAMGLKSLFIQRH